MGILLRRTALAYLSYLPFQTPNLPIARCTHLKVPPRFLLAQLWPTRTKGGHKGRVRLGLPLVDTRSGLPSGYGHDALHLLLPAPTRCLGQCVGAALLDEGNATQLAHVRQPFHGNMP
ncbi:hypothetical protein [Caudoviricetes sp.]|nr:hypothetical protein [Caudoviricetes sp.]